MSVNFLGYISSATGSGNALALNEKIIYLAEPIGTGVLAINDDFNFVRLTGSQNIEGIKNFKNDLVIDKQDGGIIMPHGLSAKAVEGRGYISGDQALSFRAGTNSIVLEKEDGNYTHIQAEKVYLISNDIIMSSRPKVNGTGILLSGDITNQSISYTGSGLNSNLQYIIYDDGYIFLSGSEGSILRTRNLNQSMGLDADDGSARIVSPTRIELESNEINFTSRPRLSNLAQLLNPVGLLTFSDQLDHDLFLKEIFPYPPEQLAYRPINQRYQSIVYPEYYEDEYGRSGYNFFLGGNGSIYSDRPVYINDGGDWTVLYDTGYFGYQNRWIVINQEWNSTGGYQIAYVAGGESSLPQYNSWSGLRTAGTGNSLSVGYSSNKLEVTSKIGFTDIDSSKKTFLETVTFKKDIVLSGAYPVQNSGVSLGIEMSNGIYFDDFYKSPYIKYYAGYENTLEIRSPGGSPGALNLINGNEKILLDGDGSIISYTAYAGHDFYGDVRASKVSSSDIHITRLPGTGIGHYGTDSSGILFHNSWSLPFNMSTPSYAARIYTLSDGEEFIISGKSGTPSLMTITNGPINSPTNENISIDNDDHSISLKADAIRFSSVPNVNGTGILLSGQGISSQEIEALNNRMAAISGAIYSLTGYINNTYAPSQGVGEALFNLQETFDNKIQAISGDVYGFTGYIGANYAKAQGVGEALFNLQEHIFTTMGLTGNSLDGFSRVSPPASPISSGLVGQYTFDTGYFYICTQPNFWGRISLNYNW